ncbi:hypothetical protein MMU07_20490 [Aquiflexum sp. LQ15W]|uniref:hypothetical protein n=1 Tax=Cognataquiflexum nitidum TaxID=2922272 RepID=UPI001F13A59D|nr:hypothetical protein [Cognataquiflexum nitidum]MCH6201968.1 hypothetical protein [Cognataquiflexum nitidum]
MLKVLKTVNDFGFSSFNLKEADFLKLGNVIQLGYPPLRIDILTKIDGVDFKNCFEEKFILDIEGLKVNFISIENLKKYKRASGRLRDLDDLENLNA